MSQIPNVPQDIILDILYCLPAKSLARFRCVSKLWLSILTHSKFIKTHLNKNRQNKKLLVVYNSSSLHALTLTPQNHYVSRKLNFPSNLDRNWFKIVGSCGGLVLALNGNKEPKGMFLINPTTSKYKKVSEAPLIVSWQPSLYMDGFGYDECTDDFKVVRLSYFNGDIPELDTLVDVYSLKANCWRSIGVSPFDHFLCVDALGVLLHGSIHWSAYTRSNFSPVIAAFDFSTEKFRGLEVPPYDIDGSKSSFSKLGVIDCCLCMIIEDYVSGMDVWTMKEYGVQRSWIKLIRVSYGSDFLVPVRLIGNHELVLSNMNVGEYGELKIFNLKDERIRSFIVDGVQAMFRDGWAFVESLVSPSIENIE